jgi:restriction system protein
MIVPRYWVIAPYESNPSEPFNKVWQFDLANNLISVGWTGLGNISKMDKQELAKAVATTYPEKPPGTKGLITNMMWAFYHEVAPGDFIIARRGLKTIAAIGKVIQPASYIEGKVPNIDHANILEVAWQSAPRDKVFPSIVFLRPTLSEISELNFQTLTEGVPAPTESAQEVEDQSAFVLEKYLEDFIVSNFQTIFKGSLKIYEDSEGNGQQYYTEVGPIDILATEPKSNSLVVIELKKGRSSDKVIGQVLRYMGWVKKNLCSSDQQVKGIIICSDPDPKLSYALEMTTGIDVRYYSVSFKLESR